jgi:hypothetical protein
MKTTSIISSAPFLLLAVLGSRGAAQDTTWHRGERPQWRGKVTLDSVYTLGTGPDYRIRVFYGMAVHSDGRAYVFDLNPEAASPHIDAYSPTGAFIKTFGRPGSGPGEYRVVVGMVVIGDTLLAALDPANARVSFFTTDGRFTHSFSLTRSPSGVAWFGLSADKSGLLYLRYPARIAKPPASANPADPDTRARYLRLRMDGRVVDSLLAPPLRGASSPSLRYSASATSFIPSAFFDAGPGAAVVGGRGGAYRIYIDGFDGRVTAIDRPWTPVRLESDEKSEWVEYANDASRRQPGGPYEIPDTKPAFKELRVDSDGRIWVGLYTAATKRSAPPATSSKSPVITWQQDPVFDVFATRGEYLGRVACPPSTQFAASKGDFLWLQSTGPDGEHLITAYRIRR